MKKFISMVVAITCTLGAMATDYTGRLAVSIDGNGVSQSANVNLSQQEDGTYTLLIKNFCLVNEATEIGVGNIEIDNLEVNEEFGFQTTKVTDRNITITEGDDPNISPWLGPQLGEVPITMSASFNDQVLSVNIDIFFAPLEQTIKVDFVGMNPEAAPGPQGKKGDVTGDEVVDIADVNAVINIMLGKVEQTPTADINGDGNVDIADVNAVINIMLGK